MTALDLIAQILLKPEFVCTEKQLRFLRDLIEQERTPKMRVAHIKKQMAAIRREITHCGKEKKIIDAKEHALLLDLESLIQELKALK